jgi:hypothetical protein
MKQNDQKVAKQIYFSNKNNEKTEYKKITIDK